MYAVIETGGKQYRVAVGETVRVETLPAEVGQDALFCCPEHRDAAHHG